jgi:uncharacterized protein (DUF342 family)
MHQKTGGRTVKWGIGMINKEELQSQGFAPDQINEIEEGIRDGLDVSIYAHKEYLAIQMRQIRFGLQEGLPVEKYAGFYYDWFQMEEIRKGLKAGIDVDKYAFPDIPYDTMRQIRKGFAEGLDLSRYRYLKAGVLREFRKALADNVNIVQYIKEGYVAEQLREIRLALETGVNIDPYLKKEFRGIAIAEIREGLERGVDVSAYAIIDLNWQQMREIRIGMENRIDTTLYESPYYSWQQMREIRLGLENGLDVTSYKSLMYTAADMKHKRLVLQGDIEETRISYGSTYSAGDTKGLYITVSKDEMSAFIQVEENAAAFTRGIIMETLHKAGIYHGIQEKAIDKLLKGEGRSKPVLVAKGNPPKTGKDGYYEFFFKTEKERSPKILEDGSVDYLNTEWFEMVGQGEKVAYYHEAKAGESGYTVLGRNLPARKGREMSLLAGKGFLLLPDKKTYLAIDAGKVELVEGRLEISKMLVLSDVTIATGRVDFEGSVYIKGNVGSGVTIKAAEDIFIDGYVEAAAIESGRNVVLRKGMNASNNGSIRALGNITGGFFEAVGLYAGGNIQANSSMNASLYAEGEIIINGTSGALVGGTANAAMGIHAYDVGNRVGLPTYIKLGVQEKLLVKQRAIRDKMNEVQKQMTIFQNAYMDYRAKYPVEIRNTMDIYLKIEKAIFTKEKELDKLSFENIEIEKKLNAGEDVKAVIRGTLYEGAVIEIGGVKWNAEKVQNVTLKKIDKRIAVFSNAKVNRG